MLAPPLSCALEPFPCLYIYICVIVTLMNLILIPSVCVIKIATAVVTLLIIYQIRSSLDESEGTVGMFEEHKQ